MGLELIYTSARKGLKPGSIGFCTVAMSRQLSPSLAAALESLSGYRHLFMAGHASYAQNPVNFCHYLVPDRGRLVRVIARISSAPADYTGRTNKLAHFMVLNATELVAAGPACLLQKPSLMMEAWSGEPRWLDNATPIPTGDSVPARCTVWERVTGDAGWAGDLLQRFCDQPEAPVHIVCNPGTPMLDLFAEALALLPKEARWQIAFSTYFTGLPVAGIKCHWRGVVAGAPSTTGDIDPKSVIDLTRSLGRAPDGPCHQTARSGTLIDLSQLRIPVVNRGDSATPGSLKTVPTRKPGIGMNATADVFDLAPISQQDKTAIRSSQLSNQDESGNGQNPRRRRRWILPAVLGTLALVILMAAGKFLVIPYLRAARQLVQAAQVAKMPRNEKASSAKAAAAKAAAAKTATTQAAATRPATTQAAATRPATTQAAATRPAMTQAAATKPAAAKTAATKPVAAKTYRTLMVSDSPLFAVPAKNKTISIRTLKHVRSRVARIPGARAFRVAFPPAVTSASLVLVPDRKRGSGSLPPNKWHLVRMGGNPDALSKWYIRWSFQSRAGFDLKTRRVLAVTVRPPNNTIDMRPTRWAAQEVASGTRNGRNLAKEMAGVAVDFKLSGSKTERVEFLAIHGPDKPHRRHLPHPFKFSVDQPKKNLSLVVESFTPTPGLLYQPPQNHSGLVTIRLMPVPKSKADKWIRSIRFRISGSEIGSNYGTLLKRVRNKAESLGRQLKRWTKHPTKAKKKQASRIAQIRERFAAEKKRLTLKKHANQSDLTRLTSKIRKLKGEMTKYEALKKKRDRMQERQHDLESFPPVTLGVELYPGGPVLETVTFEGPTGAAQKK